MGRTSLVVSTPKILIAGRPRTFPNALSTALRSALLQVARETAVYAGSGRKNKIDQTAVDIIRLGLKSLPFGIKVVTSEGEKDNAPRFLPGEMLGGSSKWDFDIAIDPIDGTKGLAGNFGRAVASVAISKRRQLQAVPEFYFERILVPQKNASLLRKNDSLESFLKRFPKRRKKSAIVFERPRNEKYVRILKDAGWQISFESSSEVAAAMDVLASQFQLLVGIGGGPETVLIAAAARERQGRMIVRPNPMGKKQIAWQKNSEFLESKQYGETFFVRGPSMMFTAYVDY